MCLLAAALVLVETSPAAIDGTAADLLRELRFSAADLASIARGEPIARVLDTDSREIAVVGAIQVRAARERFVQRFRTVDYLKASKAVLDAAAFSSPPRIEDLNGVPLQEYDLDVRECRPGDCRVRLSAEDIARFTREVDWQSSGWRGQSAGVWRSVLGTYAIDYSRKGTAALPVYANKEQPLDVADESALLLDRSSFLSAYVPGVFDQLRRPMNGSGERGDEMLYWSVEDFGIRRVLRMTHQVIHHATESQRMGTPVVIASRQLYATHYLDASLGFIFALESGSGKADGFYMISVNRARTRSLTGFFRRFVRSTVQSRCRDAMDKILRTTKRSLEEAGTRSSG